MMKKQEAFASCFFAMGLWAQMILQMLVHG